MEGGKIKVQITGADIPHTIDLLCRQGVSLYDVHYDGMLSASVQVQHNQFRSFQKIAERGGNEIRTLGVYGSVHLLKQILTRPILIAAVGLLVFLSVWLPGKILFVAVEGAERVSVPQILVQAEKSGVFFGANRRDVRSENVKNQLLQSIPQLRWAGVTTEGCTATIHVLEDESNEVERGRIAYSNVVAGIDGVIIACTVTSGVAVCSVGDAVKSGQVLISGYQDLGIVVRMTRSMGEVFAQTERSATLITPTEYLEKGEISGRKTNYSVLIGKNRINLSKGSGIYYTGCDKIYTDYYLTLPGGHILPAALSVEQIIEHSQAATVCEPEQSKELLLEQSDSFLIESMVSGRSQRAAVIFDSQNGFDQLTAHYSCVEMIGREQEEEINIQYGKDD